MNARIRSLFVLFALTIVACAGCSGGVGRTSGEIDEDFRRVVEFDSRMLVDDISLFTQTEHPMRTSKWLIR